MTKKRGKTNSTTKTTNDSKVTVDTSNMVKTYYYYNYQVTTTDPFEDYSKRIESYILIKSFSEEDARNRVHAKYKEIDLPIIKLTLISIDKL